MRINTYHFLLLLLSLFCCSTKGQLIPTITVSSNTITVGQSINFSASASLGAIQTYTWNFGDATTSGGAIVNHTFSTKGIYSVTLSIQDNASGSAAKSLLIYVLGVDEKITSLHMTTPVLLTNKKIEASFAVKGPYTNVYNPDEVSVDAIVTLPDKTSLTVPCFYYEKASYKPDTWSLEGSRGYWMLRFSTPQTGLHKVSLKLTDATGVSTTPEQSFSVTEGTTKGIIQLDRGNRQYFRHSTGEPFYPFGINVGWGSTSMYKNIITNLGSSHANFIRYWQTPFDGQALESSIGNRFYKGLGIYSQEGAGEQDSVLNLCEVNGVFIQITIFQHGMFSENVDSNWSFNPYNSAKGGPLTKAEQYFYDPTAKAYTKKLLRYIVARWGYSTNIFAWELFNEVQFTGVSGSQSSLWSPAVNSWHDEMSKYVKSLDAFDHIVTTSAEDARLPALSIMEGIDNVQYHLYTSNLLSTQVTKDKGFVASLSSVINGEYGTNNAADVAMDDQRVSIWTSIMTRVPHLMWIWQHYEASEWTDLFKVPVQYLADEDISAQGALLDWPLTAKYVTQDLNAVGFKSDSHRFAIIYDPNNRDNLINATIDFSTLPAGDYHIKYYNTLTGEVTEGRFTRTTGFKLTLPQFSKAIAIKLTYLGPVTGRENTIQRNFSVYPNPTHDEVNLNIQSTTKISVRISDVMGRDIDTIVVNGKDYENTALRLSLKKYDLQSGVYIVSCNQESQIMTQRVQLITD